MVDRRLEQVSHRKAPVDEVMEWMSTYRRRHDGWSAKHFFTGYRKDGGTRSYTWVKSRLREAALVVPLERLLAETDAPYLAPQSFRGKRCEPAHVMTTLTFLAQLKGLPPEQLIGQVVKNGEQAYRLC